MKKYRVISLSVGGHSNRIFYAKEEVSENAFPPGHADKLVEEGHLELIEEGKKAKQEVAESDTPAEQVKETKPKGKK